MAFVVDGPLVRLYRNGIEVASGPCDRLLAKSPVSWLTIGCLANKTGEKPQGYYWYGRIDELAIFNSALSGESIRQLYENKRRPPPSGGEEAKQASVLQNAERATIIKN